MIKFHVVKEAKEAVLFFCTRLLGELSSQMTIIRPDIGVIYSLLTAKCIDLSLLMDYSTSFKNVRPPQKNFFGPSGLSLVQT